MQVSDRCPRIVVNTEPVGQFLGLNFNDSTRDHLLQGQCDEELLELSIKLGWESELLKHVPDMSQHGQDLVRVRCVQDKDVTCENETGVKRPFESQSESADFSSEK